MNKTIVALVSIIVIVCLAQFTSCNNNEQSLSDKNIKEGFELSQKYCGSCHLLPKPDLLNKKTWAEFVLPKMSALLGFRRFASDYIVVISDSSKIMTLEQWKNIVRYYISLAPEDPPGRESSSQAINMQLPHFKVEMPATGINNPATTMVLVDTNKKEIVFADGITEHIYTLTEQPSPDSIKVGVGVSNFYSSDSGIYALTMGVLHPSDARLGNLSILDNKSKSNIIIDSLQRPVHAKYADLNGDNQDDIVICEFGNTTGQLSWFENKGDKKFVKHVLRALPGSVKTEVVDFNRDGLPDIIALMAQADEGFFIYYNEGNGRFSEKRVLRLLPTYGSNYFELIDFNSDGYPDILTSNGDNGDYPPILKPYHGIRIYMNNGKNEFSEKIFLPVNGIGKVIGKDFDADGDIDLASISYFPDYEQIPEESFVYWRNDGDLDFHPFSFPESTAGRWLTMDANDLDGDGDIDIVLGNAKFPLGAVPPALMKKWETYSPSVLILRNTLR